MHTSFTFNQKTSFQATSEIEENRVFVRMQENYINDLLRVRGYVYLEHIYTIFGVKWNPEWVNSCITYRPNNRQVKLKIVRENEDGFDIDIQ